MSTTLELRRHWLINMSSRTPSGLNPPKGKVCVEQSPQLRKVWETFMGGTQLLRQLLH
jgi:hypothetical protein